MKCALCNAEILERDSHSGHPLCEGRVCYNCNWKVIRERLHRIKETEKPAEEDIAVIGSGGPVNTTDPMADFEKYAKQFEETFILGNTPVRKEKVENKTKIKDGEIIGEIDSMEKEVEAEQLEPIKSATEALYGFSEVAEFVKLCKEIGIEKLSDLRRFLEENPGDTLEELKKYRKELGKEFKIIDQE